MTLKFWPARPESDAREVRYTHSRLKLIGAPVLRVVMSYAGFGGAPIPTSEDMAARPSIPRFVWWRTAARDGVKTAEEFANSGVRLPRPPRGIKRPR
jgi:hypothetical protein